MDYSLTKKHCPARTATRHPTKGLSIQAYFTLGKGGFSKWELGRWSKLMQPQGNSSVIEISNPANPPHG
jgi:hypothetical protein